MIQVQQASRHLGTVTALDAMTWDAAPGAVTCLLGPNGAGKTTAVECAVGLQRPDAGTVRVLGADPWRAGPEHRARVGVMLQDGGLPQAVRPIALLRHLARMYAAPAPVDDLVAALGIDTFADRTVRRLSGGQRQRLALAASLAGAPEVLFLDEPTAGMDPHARREVHDLVRRTADTGTTVLLTTHSFTEAERLADHVVIVAAGRTVEAGSVIQLAAGTSLEQRYFAVTDTRGQR